MSELSVRNVVLLNSYGEIMLMIGRKGLYLGQGLLIFIAAIALLQTPDLPAAEYTLTNLRLLSGETVGDIHPFTPGAINNLGQTTGLGYLTQDRQVNVNVGHPVFYDPCTEHFVNLGDMEGNMGESGLSGNGYGINDTGWVTGRNYNADGRYRAFYWKDLNGNGQTDPGEMNNLGVDPPFVSSVGTSVNNMGQVVGYQTQYDPVRVTQGWLWTDSNGNHALDAGEKINLGDYIPSDINDSAQIAMRQGDHAYRWQDANSNGVVDPSELVTIPNTPNAANGGQEMAKSVNASGAIAGVMDNNWDYGQGYYWSDANGDGEATNDEIETFGAYNQETHVRGLNDLGQVVGGTYAWRYVGDNGGERRAFVWDAQNGLRDLNGLIDEYSMEGHGPFILSQAEGINNLGQIVVTGHFENPDSWNKQDHMILLTPIPEIPGDFDHDGDVDGTDFLVWQRSPCMGALADWQDHFGATGSSAAAIPEPSSLLLVFGGGLFIPTRRRKSDARF